MKLKLDENLGQRPTTILHRAGHDVTTVAQQNISGISDIDLINLCRRESRALVTLDLDFANPLQFRRAIIQVSQLYICHLRLVTNTSRARC